MREAVIVAGARTAVGKAVRGSLADERPEDMGAAVVAEVLKRAPGVTADEVDDVIMGCALPEGPQGLNVARICALRAGLPHTVPAMTINRFCSSGLQAIALAVQQIMSGMGSCVIAGGVESMSLVPMTGIRLAPDLWMAEHYHEIYVSMGQTAENVARQYRISREEQDEFAYRSHMRAIAAQDAGKFRDEIVPLQVEQVILDAGTGREVTRSIHFDVDEGPRRDTSPEALAALKPAFAANGTVTAGNSSQTSDGAASVMLMERCKAEALNLKPLARLLGFAVSGVPPEVMGIGPIAAIPKVLKLTGLSLSDIGLIELNEAFASQALAVIHELDLNEEITNVNGGAIALGHPLGCTGAKLTVQIINEMKRRDVRYGLVSMCIGGGMGAAGILERLA
jgi:acetyl-CoA acyltransferase